MMKLFKTGAEIRLTRQDLKILLENAISQKVLAYGIIGEKRIANLTLHPGNKYVARITIEALTVKK